MDTSAIDHVLTTTRTVRKRLDLDRPVPREVIEECLNLALQAPTGSNAQGWRFVVVTDPQKRLGLAKLYRRSFELYSAQMKSQAPPPSSDPRGERFLKVVTSAVYLAENFERVPVHVLFCLEGDLSKESSFVQASQYGSILPAAWSFMLALRSRGLGAAWTTLHLLYAKEAAEILGIPEGFTQAALLPVAYTKGTDFKPAKRVSLEKVTYWNNWGES